MSPQKRIFLNVVATYGRSLYTLAVGLFCGRWTLMALGQVDYGLVGLVGGMTAFVSFINSMMAISVGRFLAVSVGEAQVTGSDGLANCRKWFSVAVTVHTVLPVVLILIGYPLGEWAVRSFLAIPPNRVVACVWVWRTVCLSCFLGMVSVPFNAMYTAKQYIAELTIYSFVTTTLNALVMYYMVTHPSDWLVRYAIWAALVQILPQVIIAIRAVWIFPECRFRIAYARSLRDALKMASFAAWSSIGSFGAMLASQGGAILLNKYFGPVLNAAQSVGGRLSGEATTLCGSMTAAFAPAIQNAYGAGNYPLMHRLINNVNKIGTLLILIFALPLSLEVDEVLRLWLQNPPEHAGFFCIYSLAWLVIDRTSYGYMIAVNAKGKIALYQVVLGGFVCMSFPLTWLLLEQGLGIYALAMGAILTQMLCAWGRVFFARHLLGISIREWFYHVLVPLFVTILFVLAIGSCIRLVMDSSLLRVVVTSGVVEAVLIPIAWFVLLDDYERQFCRTRFNTVFHKLRFR